MGSQDDTAVVPASQRRVLDIQYADSRIKQMDPQFVEAELGRFRMPGTEVSVLEYIQNPGPGETELDAAKTALERQADKTEKAGVVCSYIWFYVQMRSLWDMHVNPDIRSARAWLANLDQNTLTMLNIMCGTSTQAARRSSLGIIVAAWGDDWAKDIPAHLRPPGTSELAWPKRLLYQIAANCRSGFSRDDALARWSDAYDRRMDNSIRRELRIRSPRTPHLITEDVASLNRAVRDEDIGRRTIERFMPEMEEDRIALRNFQPTPMQAATRETDGVEPAGAKRKSRDGSDGTGDARRKRRLVKENDPVCVKRLQIREARLFVARMEEKYPRSGSCDVCREHEEGIARALDELVGHMDMLSLRYSNDECHRQRVVEFDREPEDDVPSLDEDLGDDTLEGAEEPDDNIFDADDEEPGDNCDFVDTDGWSSDDGIVNA